MYRRQTDLSLEEDFLAGGTFVANGQTTLELHQIVKDALAVWLVRHQSREWKFEVDVDYADWTAFLNLNLNLSNGLTVPFPCNYGDAFVVMMGTEHKWLQPSILPGWDLALRGSYVRSEPPIPSNTFELGVPDSAFNAISVWLRMLCQGNGGFLHAETLASKLLG